MSIFAKKAESDARSAGDAGATAAAMTVGGATAGAGRGYGIAEAIQLMRGLPVDQHPDLVVRVVRATLASLNVQLPDIIEDAARKQKTTQERIAAVYTQIAALEKQLEGHRKEIAALEADLKETTSVKERLQTAERSAAPPGPAGSSAPPPFTHATPAKGSGSATPVPKPPETRDEALAAKD